MSFCVCVSVCVCVCMCVCAYVVGHRNRLHRSREIVDLDIPFYGISSYPTVSNTVIVSSNASGTRLPASTRSHKRYSCDASFD